ncbi:ARM repeat-containing protein [Auriculariales sp. MPI-PUGE-AT-0066]|nr:ARM repeat-containing protein [Auriculariales sp. MPI-PUGE-AT-0066]
MERVQQELSSGSATTGSITTRPGLPQLTIKTPDPRRRPGPINIDAARAPMTPGPMSALATARIITDINTMAYPDHIKSPRIELNINAPEGKFRYDRDFLMQFMEVCTEKPDHLPPRETLVEAIGPIENRPPRKGSMGPPIERRGSEKFPMGGFQANIAKSKMDTFVPSRPSSMGNAVPFPGGANGPNARPQQMQRTPSGGGPGQKTHRTRSQRGNNRESKLSTSTPINMHPNSGLPGFEPVEPLQRTDNAWGRRGGGGTPAATDGAEIVERKVKSLLNKLTLEKFDTISDQIIEWANKSEKEKDGRTLIQVIRLVFEKATDEAAWSQMYARLCRKMMEQISPGVMDEGIRNADGQPITGGHLFRKYLLNRCQEDFERGWSNQAATAKAAAEKAVEDDEAKKAGGGNGEEVLYSVEYYAAQKAKRQGLGLVRFIGELFKLQMLTERIMHECIKKLLSNVDNPGEEEIESICKLLSTVGQALDTTKARSHMDIYFRRMKDLSDSNNIDSRMRFMLQDVIELRHRNWIPRNAVAAPTTIAAVHDQAAKEKAEKERETLTRMNTMSRGGSRRGDNRSEYGSQVGADGWSTPAGRAPSAKVGDLSQFGKISKATPGVPTSLGPSSVFVGKKAVEKREPSSLSRASSSNPFAALTENPGANAADAPIPSRSRKTSVDFGSGGSDVGGGRRKLQLLPRSKPLEEVKADEKAETPDGSDDDVASPDEDTPPKKVMSEAEVKQQVTNDTKEFFAIRKLDEAEQYFESLPDDQRYRMVDSVFGKALEGKDADATLAGDLFGKVFDAGKLTTEDLEKGLAGMIELLDDIAVDAPAAYALSAKIMFLAKLDEDAVKRLGQKIAVEGEPLVAPKDKLLKEYQKLSS